MVYEFTRDELDRLATDTEARVEKGDLVFYVSGTRNTPFDEGRNTSQERWRQLREGEIDEIVWAHGDIAFRAYDIEDNEDSVSWDSEIEWPSVEYDGEFWETWDGVDDYVEFDYEWCGDDLDVTNLAFYDEPLSEEEMEERYEQRTSDKDIPEHAAERLATLMGEVDDPMQTYAIGLALEACGYETTKVETYEIA